MTPQQKLALEVVQFALDIAGCVDQTGIADGMSGLISLGRGKWLDAGLSAVSMVPLIGDLAKGPKLARYVKSIGDAIRVAEKNFEFAATLRPALVKVKEALDKVPAGKLPAAAEGPIRQIKTQIDAFLKRRTYSPNPKHELPGTAPGVKRSRLDLTSDEAYELLNDAARSVEVPGKKQILAVKNGKIYAFQPDGTAAGSFHAYPITGNEVAAKYPSAAGRVAQMLGVDPKRLSRMD